MGVLEQRPDARGYEQARCVVGVDAVQEPLELRVPDIVEHEKDVGRLGSVTEGSDNVALVLRLFRQSLLLKLVMNGLLQLPSVWLLKTTKREGMVMSK